MPQCATLVVPIKKATSDVCFELLAASLYPCHGKVAVVGFILEAFPDGQVGFCKISFLFSSCFFLFVRGSDVRHGRRQKEEREGALFDVLHNERACLVDVGMK